MKTSAPIIALLLAAGFCFYLYTHYSGELKKRDAQILQIETESTEKFNRSIEQLKKQLSEKENQIKNTEERLRKTEEELKQNIDQNQKNSLELKDSLNKLQKEFNEYKESYKISARNKIKGQKFESIVTLSGQKFEDVTVSKVDPAFLHLFYLKGASKIPLKDLPQEWKNNLVYSEDEAKPFLANLEEEKKKLSIMDAKAEQELAKQRKKEYAEEYNKISEYQIAEAKSNLNISRIRLYNLLQRYGNRDDKTIYKAEGSVFRRIVGGNELVDIKYVEESVILNTNVIDSTLSEAKKLKDEIESLKRYLAGY